MGATLAARAERHMDPEPPLWQKDGGQRPTGGSEHNKLAGVVGRISHMEPGLAKNLVQGLFPSIRISFQRSIFENILLRLMGDANPKLRLPD